MKGKHIAIIIVAVVSLGGAGAVAVIFAGVGIFYVAQKSAASQNAGVASLTVMKPRDSFRFKQDFRINTADSGDKHFIKLKLSLGYEQGNAALGSELTERREQLRNVINLILSQKARADLDSVRKQLELREEIKKSINHLLEKGKVEEVYFHEFAVN